MTYQRLTDEFLIAHAELIEQIKTIPPGESLFYHGSPEEITKLRRLCYSILNGLGIKHQYVVKLKVGDLELHHKTLFQNITMSKISYTQKEQEKDQETIDSLVQDCISEKHPLTYIRNQAKARALTFEQAIKAQKEITRILGTDSDTNPLFASKNPIEKRPEETNKKIQHISSTEKAAGNNPFDIIRREK